MWVLLMLLISDLGLLFFALNFWLPTFNLKLLT